MDVIEISGKVAAMLLLGFLGCVAAFGKVLLDQFEKRMNERAKAQDRHLQEQAAVLATLRDKVAHLDRDLPLQYVRREDWIRFGASIDHKQDRLAELVGELKVEVSRARR